MTFGQVKEDFKITIDGKTILVKIRYSPRAKRTFIRISTKGDIELVLPVGGNVSKAKSFLLQKLSWLREKVSEMQRHSHTDKSYIPIFGERHLIKHIASEDNFHVERHKDVIEIKSPIDAVEVMLIEYLKEVLLKEIKKSAKIMAKEHKLQYKHIVITAGISKWGSCAVDGTLSFNWRLIFAPKNITQYLVAHELAHLKERNHGPKFWQFVEKIYPGSLVARFWLKKEGSRLHKILENYK